jgi:hypothetical protein
MKNIYVSSISPFCGKSMVCLLLLLFAEKNKKKIGYFKLFGTSFLKTSEEIVDEDVRFFKSFFEFKEKEEILCSLLLTPDVVVQILQGKKKNLLKTITNKIKDISKEKDILVIDNGGNLGDGYSFSAGLRDVVKEVPGKIILVCEYTSELIVDEICFAKEIHRENLAGVVINRIPRGKYEMVKDLVGNFLKEKGIKVFAFIPRDRILSTISVAEIIEKIGGEVLCAIENTEELVENLSVGAMNVESALRYFRRTPNKAVITGGDRADIQLAALETQTKCLILTGGNYPPAPVLSKAEEKKVPVIVIKGDTLSVIGRIEKIMGRFHIEGVKKIERIKEITSEYFQEKELKKLIEK